MRRVKVFKFDYTAHYIDKLPPLILDTEGVFHGFSIDSQQVPEGIMTIPVAIVELSDGRIILPYAERIQFMEENDEQRQG